MIHLSNDGVELDAKHQLLFVTIAVKPDVKPDLQSLASAIDEAGYEPVHTYVWKDNKVVTSKLALNTFRVVPQDNPLRNSFLIFLCCSVFASLSRQGKPVFSENAPMVRWLGCAGSPRIPVRNVLYDGQQNLGSNLDRSAYLLHVEGVYTWHRSIRLTLKVPVMLDAERRVLSASGETVEHRKSGLGDPTIALPLKKYFNLDGRSGS